MKTAVIWDLDDTLYLKNDCLLVAAKAIRDLSETQIGRIQIEFPKYSDIYFDQHAKNEITFEEMRTRRAIDTFNAIGETISEDEAIRFQDLYMGEQYNGIIRKPLYDLLIDLKNSDVTLGIITNGTRDHQLAKIKALGVDKIIDDSLIIASGELGITKPDIEIFNEMQKRIGDNCRYFYIGDTYQNDIEALKDSSWKSIWFNHKHHIVEESCADYEISSYEQLYSLVRNLILD